MLTFAEKHLKNIYMDLIALIFSLLKTGYSNLGLGDEILQAHAEMLAGTGFVTADNAKTIVEAQKPYLENLQKQNDARATKAAETARENAKKEFEDEAKKKANEEARKQAEKEAKEKAEREAREKAEKEAAEKAAKEAEEKAKREEEERKRREELEKHNAPDYVKQMQDEFTKALNEQREAQKSEREAFQKMLEEMQKKSSEASETYRKQVEELSRQTKEQTDVIAKMKKDAETAAAEEAARKHREKIVTKAKELNIPQSRIDEGFVIADDADDATIDAYLGKVAANYKSLNLPRHDGFTLTDQQQATKEDMSKVADLMIK